MNKKTVARITLLVWVFIWLLFLLRPYFKNDLLKEYSTLLKLSADGKRAYVTGTKLYEFIKFCNASLPPASSYRVVGLEAESLDHRHVVYYLYPNIDREPCEFLLVYNIKDFSRKGYRSYKDLSPGEYILRKVD